MKKTSALDEYLIFYGTNFELNGYGQAQYRATKETLQLDQHLVPARLEALNQKEEWQQHPVIFIHEPSRSFYSLVIFTYQQETAFSSGILARRFLLKPDKLDFQLYQKALLLGLTKGIRTNLKNTWKDGFTR